MAPGSFWRHREILKIRSVAIHTREMESRVTYSCQQKNHAAIHCANEMAHLHNCIIRDLNCIYLQAPYVRAAEDARDFLFFIKAWSSFVKHHHDVEEELVFHRLEAFTGKTAV